ncbi:MmcQ/YjbR family DNA-binding protein [Arthrobacter woluwensis]|uniref:Predicted DNA-binding protein, MmcQ/YjbR family n=1 Tax=Arthrobacter woluwensis TaxID=156980 RepID=A0A1H4W1R8_9MICC|nr:MmcQ/YjbR family DNA-binding protein [Arthrobacter woluwensis]SEC87090.1 Predicted DNA-binding protein, MmcQ/YjbR family [Arthrobacter woluwensis]
MDARELREFCLGFPGAIEDFPFDPDTSVFKVASEVEGARHPAKMFALTRLRALPLSVSLKCDPVLALQLRAGYPQITGAWHLNKKHWNGVLLEGLPDELLRNMIEDSYDLVVSGLSRRQQEQLSWKGLIERG